MDVIVIGGGLAGLGAAKALCDHGNFNVVLLEADSVVGGRVRNDCLPDGTTIPLGAASFHGRKGNSLLAYAKAEHLGTESQEFQIRDDHVLHTYSEGNDIPSNSIDRLQDEVFEILDGIIECYKKKDWSSFSKIQDQENSEVYCNSHKETSLDLHDYVHMKMVPTLQAKTLDQHYPAVILEGLLAYEGITEGCKGLHGINLELYGAWSYLDDSTDLLYKQNPYHKIIPSLVSKIPNEVIKLNKEVCSIDQTDQEKEVQGAKIIVRCVDGSTYEAKHIIYTCSLGVLKHHAAMPSSIFVPALPSRKLSAITDVGMSLVDKVFLHFDGPLLSGNQYDQFRLYWTEKDKANPRFVSNPWIFGFQFIRIFPNELNYFIYHTFLIGEDAVAIGKIDEQEVAQVILYALEMFLAKPIPRLLGITVSHWGKPFTRGSYSYTPQGITLDKREELSKPVASKYYPLQILFAGEATSIDQFGCAHSAFDSGVREAKRLINYYG